MLQKFEIGHYSDNENGTGVTAIICKGGAVGAVSVRGASPATVETDLLKLGKTVCKINAVVLSGGSAFGLEAASGVRDYLFENGFGYNAGKYRVPIVAGASIYDLEFKNFSYPSKKDGYSAALNAFPENFECGSIGGGVGATVGKAGGITTAAKGGVGIKLYKLNRLEIAVITVVNPLGDIVENGKIILGAKFPSGEFMDTKKIFSAGTVEAPTMNTTIGCILTNAKLTKEEASVIADLAHDGIALSVSPSHTRYDGDAFFVMASGEVNADINTLSAIIPDLTAESIRSVARESKKISASVSKLQYSFLKRMWKEKK